MTLGIQKINEEQKKREWCGDVEWEERVRDTQIVEIFNFYIILFLPDLNKNYCLYSFGYIRLWQMKFAIYA